MKVVPVVITLNSLFILTQAFRDMRAITSSIVSQLKSNPGTPVMAMNQAMQDKCVLKTYIQKISKDRCKTLSYPNTFCSGTCNSYHFPGKRPVMMQKSCKATKITTEKVRLDCPERRKRKWRDVKVVKVLGCGCTECSSSH